MHTLRAEQGEESTRLTSTPKSSRRRIAVAPNDPSLIARHAHDAVVAELEQRAGVVARRADHIEPHVLPVWIAPQVVAPVDEGCVQRVAVAGL